MTELRNILDIFGALFILFLIWCAWDEWRREKYIEKCKIAQYEADRKTGSKPVEEDK